MSWGGYIPGDMLSGRWPTVETMKRQKEILDLFSTSTASPAVKHRKDGPAGRQFRLIRDEDVSGVAGTGHVASGVEWPDGSVTLKWHTNSATASIGHYPSKVNMLQIHGHASYGRYRTNVKYVEESEKPSASILLDELSDFTSYLAGALESAEKGLHVDTSYLKIKYGKILDLVETAKAA